MNGENDLFNRMKLYRMKEARILNRRILDHHWGYCLYSTLECEKQILLFGFDNIAIWMQRIPQIPPAKSLAVQIVFHCDCFKIRV